MREVHGEDRESTRRRTIDWRGGIQEGGVKEKMHGGRGVGNRREREVDLDWGGMMGSMGARGL